MYIMYLNSGITISRPLGRRMTFSVQVIKRLQLPARYMNRVLPLSSKTRAVPIYVRFRQSMSNTDLMLIATRDGSFVTFARILSTISALMLKIVRRFGKLSIPMKSRTLYPSVNEGKRSKTISATPGIPKAINSSYGRNANRGYSLSIRIYRLFTNLTFPR